MKKVLFGFLALLAVAFVGSTFESPSKDPQAGGIESGKPPFGEPTRNRPEPAVMTLTAPGPALAPGEPSVDELAVAWATSSREQLEERLSLLASEFASDDLIARANREELSERERARLARLLRENAVLNLLLAELRLDELEQPPEEL